MSEYIPAEKVRLFWEQLASRPILKLIEGKYELPKIQARYTLLSSRIAAQYGPNLNITLSDVVPQDSTEDAEPSFGFGFHENSVPRVTIFVRTLQKIYERIQVTNPRSAQSIFETCMVIGYIHEHDHLESGHGATPNDPLEVHLRNECLAQAQTCEHTILPIVETYRLPISDSDMLFYQQWLAAGRNAESPIWTSFISSQYRPLLEKRIQ